MILLKSSQAATSSDRLSAGTPTSSSNILGLGRENINETQIAANRKYERTTCHKCFLQLAT